MESRRAGDGAKIVLTLSPPPGAADPGTLHFFPTQNGASSRPAPQTLARERAARYVLTLPVSSRRRRVQAHAGVITAANGFASGGDVVKAATIDVPLVGAVVAGPKPKSRGAGARTCRRPRRGDTA